MKKESKHVIKFKELHIKQGEEVIAWCDGYIGETMGKGDKTQHNGVLMVTLERVIFYRKGMLGEVLETIPLKAITSIERKSMLGHRTITMHTSNDKLEFKNFDKDGDAALTEAIESGRERFAESVKKPSNEAVESDDVFAKLKKLGELKDLGVINDDEFNLKKEVLMAEI